MYKHTVTELLTWMNGKSKTYGWDAIVAYDRHKANTLLHQLYLERFNSDSYIPLISTTLKSSDYTTEYLYGLKLSAPILSFANANLASSKADLTMRMVGGLIATELKAPGIPTRVDSIKQLLPLGDKKLTMTLPLENTPGSVNGREVTLDISKGENFRANFVEGDLSQEAIGSRFKVMFQSLDDKQKVFPLGSLTGEETEFMTPEQFEIRTLQAPLGNRRAEEHDGDGAVLLFIKFKGGSVGSIPPAPDPADPNGFRYLIPEDDADGAYSGAMLLSSRTLFDRIIRKHALEDVGHGIGFFSFNGSTDLAVSLKANQGKIFLPYEYKYDYNGGKGRFTADCELYFQKDGEEEPFTIETAGNRISISWKKLNSTWPFTRHLDNPGWWDDWDYGDIEYRSDYKTFYSAKVDKSSGIINFTRDGDSKFEFFMLTHDWLPDLGSHQSSIRGHIHDFYYSKINPFFQSLTIPSINTFLARNLLFPGHDAFQPLTAYVPGDLALFGHIDPVRTSMTITPSNMLIEAGKSQAFKVVGDGISNVLWSVQDTDGETLNVGTISPQGVYTAPPASELGKGYVTVLVTADGTQNAKPVKASALVSIIDSTIAVNPIFQVVAPEQEIKLSAQTIDGSAPEWTLLQPEHGASLTPHEDNPDDRLYKAGPKGTTTFTVDTVQVKSAVGSPKVIKLLILNRVTVLTLKVDDSSDPASGQVKLQVLDEDGVIDPAEEPYKLELLDGGGTLDSTTGIYKQPDSEETSFAIISVSIGSGARGWYGFLTLPLPLNSYSLIPDAFDENNPSAVWHDMPFNN